MNRRRRPSRNARREAQPADLRTLALGLLGSLPTPLDPGSETEFLQDHARSLRGREQNWPALLAGAIAEPAEADQPLAALAGQLALNPLETLVIALLQAVEEEPEVGRALAYLQAPVGGSRPTLGLLETAYGGEDRALTETLLGGAALATGLLERSGEDAPLPEQTLRLPTSLVLALAGVPGAWPGTERGLSIPPVALPASLLDSARRYADTLVRGQDRVLLIRSADDHEARSLAALMAGWLGREALFIPARLAAQSGLGVLCMAAGLLPVTVWELQPGQQTRLPTLPGYRGPRLALAGLDGSLEGEAGALLDWSLPVPARDERETLWAGYLQDPALAATLAAAHRQGAGRIARLARLAGQLAEVDGLAEPAREHVYGAAWQAEEGGLGALAQPLPGVIPPEALVLPAHCRQELELLLARCRQREELARGLGVTLTAGYRCGVRALLVGPSGTGKTLAAGWLASRLELPLYRVDLAAVSSKYIGETEKNLALLLARAEHADVVLLFDEADSLFGKRTDIRDANDRYANQQTNYLLQRIETYDGIVLLTSNSRARFDSAFSRRLDVILEFPLPGPEERRALWRRHLGEAHGLATAEFNRLAALSDLGGGHIRNAVLSAAVLARGAGRSIAYADLLAGLAVEYRKVGRAVPVELQQGA